MAEQAFEYGWCNSDHKFGHWINPYYRTRDFFGDEPYVSFVKTTFQYLGLPLPQQSEIFRGSKHDLLFLNNHGIVIRVGSLNIDDLMNPCILQPLGWIENNKNDVCVALYPGISQVNNLPKSDIPSLMAFLKHNVNIMGNKIENCTAHNAGYIVRDGAIVPVLLDLDNGLNGSLFWGEKKQLLDAIDEEHPALLAGHRMRKFFNASSRV